MQNPSVRPAVSPRERPTGAPQSEREQNRLRSGTSGFSWTIAARVGPRHVRHLDQADAEPAARRRNRRPNPELRTDTERPVDVPDSERDSRPETERRDCEERDDVRELARELRLLALPEPRELLPPAVIPVGGEPTMPARGHDRRQTARVAVQLAAAHVLVRPRATGPLALLAAPRTADSRVPPTVLWPTALLGHPRAEQVGRRLLVAQYGVLRDPQVAGRAPQHAARRVVALDEERVLREPVPGDLRLVRVEAAAQLRADRQRLR